MRAPPLGALVFRDVDDLLSRLESSLASGDEADAVRMIRLLGYAGD